MWIRKSWGRWASNVESDSVPLCAGHVLFLECVLIEQWFYFLQSSTPCSNEDDHLTIKCSLLTTVYYPNSTSQSLRIHDIHSLCSRSWPILPPLLKSHASVLPSVPILRTCGWVQYGPIIEALYNDLFLSEDFIWVPMLKVIWVDLVHVDSESAGRLETRGSPSSIEAIVLFCFFFRKNGCLLALRYESCFNPVTYYKPPLTPPFLSGICLCFHLSPDCLILDSCHRLCGIIISSMWWFSLSVSNISVRKQSHMSIKKQPCYAMLVYRDAATMR